MPTRQSGQYALSLSITPSASCYTTGHSIWSFSQSTHNWHKSHNALWSDWISELYDTMHWGPIGLEASLGRMLMASGRLCLMSTALPINYIFCQLPLRVYCYTYEMHSNLVFNCSMLSGVDAGVYILTAVINERMPGQLDVKLRVPEPGWWPVDVWRLSYLRYELQKDCAPNPNMSIHSLICNADYIDFWIQLFGPLWPHSISLAGQHWELNYWLTKTKINTHWSGSHIVCFSWFYIILRGSTLFESEIDLDLLTSNLLHWVTWKENR